MSSVGRAGARSGVARGGWFWCVCGVFVLLASSLVTGAVPAVAGSATVRVMTYNIRGAADPPPRDWASRLPLMRCVLRVKDPDLLGVQEARWRQLRDLDRALPAHDRVGRRGGGRDEFGAIFYRKDRFRVLDLDYLALSDTPDVIGSATWGNRFPRMATLVKLRDRRTGAVFYLISTHFDHQSELARVKSAELILSRVRGLAAPVVLSGDFNIAAGRSAPYDVLTGRGAFRDTWETAGGRGPVVNTYNAWGPPVAGGERIDWILARGRVRTFWAEVFSWRPAGRYASDHYPVLADLQIG